MQAAEVEQKQAWHKVLQKAEGAKVCVRARAAPCWPAPSLTYRLPALQVFDDPNLVKKKIKRIEKMKKKSGKEWCVRAGVRADDTPWNPRLRTAGWSASRLWTRACGSGRRSGTAISRRGRRPKRATRRARKR
jgi:hypothetical protein